MADTKSLAILLLECSICYETRDLLRDTTLLCGHGFHADCIASWFKTTRNCPVCRRASNGWILPLDVKVLFSCYAPINVSQVPRWPNGVKGLKAKVRCLMAHGAAIVTARKVSTTGIRGRKPANGHVFTAAIYFPNQDNRALNSGYYFSTVDGGFKSEKSGKFLLEYTQYYFRPETKISGLVWRGKCADNEGLEEYPMNNRRSFAPFSSTEGYIKPDPRIWRAAIECVLAAIEETCLSQISSLVTTNTTQTITSTKYFSPKTRGN